MLAPLSSQLRRIIATTSVALVAMVTVAYASSCSSPQRTDDSVPRLNKVSGKLPRPEPPRVERKPEPAVQKGPTVAEVVRKGCTTNVVRKLSEQIIAEGNCIRPGAYAKVPKLANVSLGKAVFPYMLKPARDALVEAAGSAKSKNMSINSMLRTVAQQYLLYRWYKAGRCNIKLAAEPGGSNHEGGLAIDVAHPARWRKTLSRHGFRWMGKKDRWHFDFESKRSKRHRGLDIEAFQRLWNRNYPDEAIGEDGGWGDDTAKALERAPVKGFTRGPQCDG
jgi:hypothetical protein